METNIIIDKAIVHILDMSLNTPICSNKNLEINDEMYEYISKQISKIQLNPSSKKYNLENNTENCDMLFSLNNDESNFINVTQCISKNIFSILKTCLDVKSCDLLYCMYKFEGIKKLAMLKLNYKDSYIHKIEDVEGNRYNKVIRYNSTLPNLSQKSDENFIYEIYKSILHINEKKYVIEDEKSNIFSDFIFNQPFTLSPKETYDTIDKISKKMVKQYFDDDVEKKIDIKKEIVNSFNTNGTLNIDDIAEKVFESDTQIKQVFNEELKNKGIKDDNIKLDFKLDKKINKKQKIKTAEGIEILIPVEYLDNTDKIAFNTNDDGTVNIMLKSLNDVG